MRCCLVQRQKNSPLRANPRRFSTTDRAGSHWTNNRNSVLFQSQWCLFFGITGFWSNGTFFSLLGFRNNGHPPISKPFLPRGSCYWEQCWHWDWDYTRYTSFASACDAKSFECQQPQLLAKYNSPAVWTECCYFRVYLRLYLSEKQSSGCTGSRHMWFTLLVGDLLSCMVMVSVGHRVLCAEAAHWPVVTVAS